MLKTTAYGIKIGIFDSGLGGLAILEDIRKALPKYDYVYLGDTKRVPYGNHTQTAIYRWSQAAVDYLFRKEQCQIVIIACNTVSVKALRRLQREYLPNHFPHRRILGVVVPTLETVVQNGYKRVGLIGTTATVGSQVYSKELSKLHSHGKLFAQATPELVPLLEENNLNKAKTILHRYLKVLNKKNIDALILGCTHYCLLKTEAQRILTKKVVVISQDKIIPGKLKNYLRRHPEIETRLSRRHTLKLLCTTYNPSYNKHLQSLPGLAHAKFRIVTTI